MRKIRCQLREGGWLGIKLNRDWPEIIRDKWPIDTGNEMVITVPFKHDVESNERVRKLVGQMVKEPFEFVFVKTHDELMKEEDDEDVSAQ